MSFSRPLTGWPRDPKNEKPGQPNLQPIDALSRTGLHWRDYSA
jgi:hypothetical protein